MGGQIDERVKNGWREEGSEGLRERKAGGGNAVGLMVIYEVRGKTSFSG